MGCGGSKGNTAEPINVKDKSQTRSSSRNTNGNKSLERTLRGSKYVKPGSSYAGSVNGDVNKIATDKGYNRRLRNNLINATRGSDIEALEGAKNKFEKHRLEDCGDLTKAYDRLYFLNLRKDLKDAVKRSHVGVLERAIADAEDSPFANQLASHIEAAKAKLTHLEELNAYSHDILAMSQSTISEIHSYHRPPACVHDVMAASYMLLGQDESTLRDWSFVQSMAGKVGRDSLIHKVREFDSSNVDERTSKRVEEIINYHQLSEVRAASNGAATFHVWASNIVDKIGKDRTNEEEKIKLEESKETKTNKGGTKNDTKTKRQSSKVSKDSKNEKKTI